MPEDTLSSVRFEGRQRPASAPSTSFRAAARPDHDAGTRRSPQARSLLDIRAAFWYGGLGRGTCDGCGDRIPRTYSRRARAANRRPPHRSPEHGGRCCLRGCQSLPLLQRSPTDERERTRTGTAPAGPGVGTRKLLQEHHDQRSPGETAGPAGDASGLECSEPCVHESHTETTSGTMQVVRQGCARRHGLHPLDAALNLLPERYLFEMRRVTIASASRAPPRTPWKPQGYSTSSKWQRRCGVRCSSPAHRRACRHAVRDWRSSRRHGQPTL